MERAKGWIPLDKAFSAKLPTVERHVAAFLERVVDASVPSVIAAYEDRVGSLEEKIAIREKIASGKRFAPFYRQTVRTALSFLASPWNLSVSDRLEGKRVVFRLAFARPLAYRLGEGFRTTDLTLPFKV